jgi:ribosomal protein L11 methyltransferase
VQAPPPDAPIAIATNSNNDLIFYNKVCGTTADLFFFTMHYLQITIPTTDAPLQEILIAQLSALGYEGFEQEETFLRAFLPEDRFDSASLNSLLAPWQLTYDQDRLEERNWNEEWEKNFQPVVVEGFCGIRAHFHAPTPGVRYDLVITPKMSFGTGHHATTYMMVQEMEHLDFQAQRVLDFGTGTGVLAILAEQRGAREVVAIDHDDWSIENARENTAANHCTRISVIKTDTIPPTPFDIILANINKHVILQQLPAIGQHLKEGGVILLSGLLQEDEQDIREAAALNNLPISERMTKGNWICLKAGKKTK